MNIYLRHLSVMATIFALVACSQQNEYDPKTLGFADKTEMEAAFLKGYHTKQKLMEMLPPASEASADSEVTYELPSPEVEVQPQVAQDTQDASIGIDLPNAEVDDAGMCEDFKACVNAMLVSAKSENLKAAMDAARQIDGFQKPERGDRKSARKLNNEGLVAIKQGRGLDAIKLLAMARDADKLDEEILNNLAHAYLENGNHTEAIEVTLDGLVLNPRRATLWVTYALANARLGNHPTGLQAMWLAWQFSANKEKMLTIIDKKIIDEQDAEMKSFYITTKTWVVENKKPVL